MLRPAGSLAEKVSASPAAGAAKWLATLSEKAWPSLALWLGMTVAVGPLSPTARLKLSLIDLPCASVAVTVIGLLPKSPSVGVPEMTPVWASMLRPAGSLAEKVRALPPTRAAKWLETLSEKAWPSSALWLGMTVAVGPLSIAVAMIGLLPSSPPLKIPENTSARLPTPWLAGIVIPDAWSD